MHQPLLTVSVVRGAARSYKYDASRIETDVIGVRCHDGKAAAIANRVWSNASVGDVVNNWPGRLMTIRRLKDFHASLINFEAEGIVTSAILASGDVVSRIREQYARRVVHP